MAWVTPSYRTTEENSFCLVQCGSRFLIDTETRYATIELELLALVWAMSKCKFYLIGLQHLDVITDLWYRS